jgi:hypothetical protein
MLAAYQKDPTHGRDAENGCGVRTLTRRNETRYLVCYNLWKALVRRVGLAGELILFPRVRAARSPAKLKGAMVAVGRE